MPYEPTDDRQGWIPLARFEIAWQEMRARMEKLRDRLVLALGDSAGMASPPLEDPEQHLEHLLSMDPEVDRLRHALAIARREGGLWRDAAESILGETSYPPSLV